MRWGVDHRILQSQAYYNDQNINTELLGEKNYENKHLTHTELHSYIFNKTDEEITDKT